MWWSADISGFKTVIQFRDFRQPATVLVKIKLRIATQCVITAFTTIIQLPFNKQQPLLRSTDFRCSQHFLFPRSQGEFTFSKNCTSIGIAYLITARFKQIGIIASCNFLLPAIRFRHLQQNRLLQAFYVVISKFFVQ